MADLQPYRKPAPTATRRSELVYEPSVGSGPLLRWFHYVFVVTFAFAMFWGTQSVGATFAVALAAMGVILWQTRRLSRVRLAVDHGDLFVYLRGARRPIQISLADLERVELDTRTIERIERDTSITGQMTASMTVKAPSDESRIVLVVGEGRVALTPARVRHSEALEWMGKIRVFLREHGWRPASEREAD